MKKVIIIGGGFAGSNAAKKLEKIKDFEITLVDKKEYFEFTPSILKSIIHPEYLSKIQIKHKDYLRNSKVILGTLNKISKTHVHLKNPSERIPYDYLIISTGSSYILPFKNHKTLQINRGKDLQEYNKKLEISKKIKIIGGGLVGIELAGELADHYKNSKKEIEIIQADSKLIPRNSKTSQEYSKKILEKKGVKIILNKFHSPKQKESKKELTFICTGISPNKDFNFNPKVHSLETNKFLQLKPYRNVFLIGDVSNIQEEKTAQNAIRQSNTAVINIKRLEKNKSLKKYNPKKTPQLISLGKDKGIFEYKNFTIKGKLPIILKNFVESREIKKLKH